MKTFLEQYFSVLLEQRDWTWTLVCGFYFIFILLVRRLFIKPLIIKAKQLDKNNYHEIKTNYLNKCALGWILLLTSTALIGFMWFSDLPLPIATSDMVLIFCIFTVSLFGIHLHLTAFAAACIKAIKTVQDSQKVL